MSAHCKSGVDKLELMLAVKLASKVATLIPWPMLGDASKSWKLNSRSSMNRTGFDGDSQLVSSTEVSLMVAS